jgi:hypothetical protein
VTKISHKDDWRVAFGDQIIGQAPSIPQALDLTTKIPPRALNGVMLVSPKGVKFSPATLELLHEPVTFQVGPQ